MPFSNRPHESDGNGAGRRTFRSFTDYRRTRDNGNGNGQGNGQRNNRPAPPENTSAENFYYLKQMSSKTPMVIVMTDGEQIHGCIEWYDRNSLKVNREGAPNLLIQKHWIKYLYKRDEA
jgi:sRNA-binding regulator protein Hfq